MPLTLKEKLMLKQLAQTYPPKVIREALSKMKG